jgi:MFS family permease
MEILRPLRRPAPRRFLLAALISSVGTGMALIAGKLYVLAATGSNALVGTLGAVGFCAGILAMGRLGPLIDRYDRRRVQVGADLYRVFLAGVVPASIVLGRFSPGVLFLVVFLMGFGHTVGFPNLSAMVAQIVPIDERPAMNGLIETSMQVGMMGGAALSGLLYDQGGIGLVYTVDLATFVVSALLFSRMDFEPLDDGREVDSLPGDSEFAAGWRYLRERPLLMVYGVAITLPWVATMSLNTVLPGLVRARMAGGPVEVGVLDAAYSLGGVVAGVLGGMAARSMGVPLGMGLALGLGVLAIGSLGAVSRLAPALPLAMAFGLGNSAFRVIHRTFVLHEVPNRVLGRVLSFFAWAGISGAAIGMLLTGRAMDHWGERAGLAVLVGAQATGLFLVGYLRWRGFLRTPWGRGGDAEHGAGRPS